MDYFDTVIPVLLSFSISVILCPIVIPFLKWLKFGQYVRDDGPKSHLKKAGTPTMGGLIILISVVVTSSLYLRDYPEILPVIFATVGFGLIGFLDDYIKIVMRRSLGLRAWQKLVLQLLVTIIFVYYYTPAPALRDADADPVYRRNCIRKIYCSAGMVVYSVFIFCHGGNCQRHKFYGRTGWACIQRDAAYCCVFYGGRDRYGKYGCTGMRSGCGSVDGIFSI